MSHLSVMLILCVNTYTNGKVLSKGIFWCQGDDSWSFWKTFNAKMTSKWPQNDPQKTHVCTLSRIILVFDGHKKDVKYKIHYIKDFFEDFSAKMASQCIIFHLSSVIPKVIQRSFKGHFGIKCLPEAPSIISLASKDSSW